ncbi:MAG: recombinase [Bacteroidales bacterium 45-6]|uniref:site-specific integrase n=1 Tax=uncultured Dysgonomonas sp. TaxID=206096 RepID=UPI000963B474|nr:site-specific integrase [uncultured Dysgonomonas sp.]OJU38616.1 MAG: recombinase [Bacteroidales bacterium 45-6]
MNNSKNKNNHANTAYSTFAVLFYINRQKIKKNGMCPLMGRISINAEIAQFSAGIDIDPSLWDAKAYRMKGKSRHTAEANRYIEQLTEKISRYYKEILDRQGYITAELVKNAVCGIGRRKENLLELFREHNEEYAKQVGVTRSGETLRNYISVYKQTERFLHVHYGMEDIALQQLEPSFIEKFDSFLRIEQGFTAHTVSGYTIILRKMVRRAISQGILHKNPFASYIPEQPPRKRRHMTQEELEKFMNVPVASKRLCHSQDMFIFATFTGLSYADMCNLSEENIHKGRNGSLWIRINRQKTGIRCDIPLLDIPLRIMEKYEPERKGGKLFNMITLSCMAINLNKVAKLCGIQKRITYHQSRHNFATLITLSKGVPLETVSQMMGHKCFRTTQIYAKLTRQKVNEDMKKLSERIGRTYKLPVQRDNKNE